MMHCPICRAVLNGADTCRRCRTELKQAQDVERRGRELVGAAMHLLALGNTAAAMRALRRAHVVHATHEVRLLSTIVTAGSRQARLREASASEGTHDQAGGAAP
jgi:methylphosphotriester-DNA--protein-cysteine methyltransferase